MHGPRVIGFSIISNFINMCLAYRFKINDIYHYYLYFLIKIIIKQMPPDESSLCVKQQRLDSGKYYFVAEFDMNKSPLLVQLIWLWFLTPSRNRIRNDNNPHIVLDGSSGLTRQATLFLYIKLI